MQNTIDKLILHITGAREILSREMIQELWSGYGKILRIRLKGYSQKSVIIKHIHLPEEELHPRGWNTDISRERKLFSYQVETHWYDQWSSQCDDACHVPVSLGIKKIGDEVILVLEDLKEAGYPLQKTSVSWPEIKAGLYWLAHFHATYLGKKPQGLWDTGTYWHLETRPDELTALKDPDLKAAAPIIDEKLRNAKYQTFVHGDAKLANFCFSTDGEKAAAVDFQYIGGGCGMKDVAYFAGSCLTEDSCEELEDEILDYYFSVLKSAIESKKNDIDIQAVEIEWRNLYHLAWTDFFRFLQGWSPGHWKIHSYSERISLQVIKSLRESGKLP
ncbi:MAG: DUF1679 domain-containing protein [Spirochaetaceae bacterium]|nr:DUF1679 domain-containing protein [Spirochaetaceae bacterium]